MAVLFDIFISGANDGTTPPLFGGVDDDDDDVNGTTEAEGTLVLEIGDVVVVVVDAVIC